MRPTLSRQSRAATRDGKSTMGARAEWLVSGVLSDGTPFEAIYDHPHGDDKAAVRIVSAWRLDS